MDSMDIVDNMDIVDRVVGYPRVHAVQLVHGVHSMLSTRMKPDESTQIIHRQHIDNDYPIK